MQHTLQLDHHRLEQANQSARPAATSSAPASSMGKVALLVGVAIAVFAASTIYSVHKEIQGTAQLAAIKDSYFPVLQRLDANTVRVDKLRDLYMEAAATGDGNIIIKADALGMQAAQVFGEINPLYPGREAEIQTLRSDLQRYQDEAGKVARAYVDQDLTRIAPMTQDMNHAFSDISGRLTGFRQASYTGFVQTLAETQRNAAINLYMGLALGLMNLGFMAVLVHFIRTNMKMMSVIAEQNATLEKRVSERTAQLSRKTADINAMLQNMKLGVSTVVPGNVIHPEYSNYLRVIFSVDEVSGKDLVGSLLANSDLGVDVKDQIAAALSAILGEDALVFELNQHLLVREMRLQQDDGYKIVQMDWSPILNDRGEVEKVLLITQDVTHLRQLELSSAKQKEELDIISKIIRISIGKLNEFIQSTNGFISENRRLISTSQGRDPQLIASLFRNMHTIKGNARTFEFTHITDAAHHAEQAYDVLRKSEDAKWDAPMLIAELDAVEAAVARYVSVNEDTLGRKGRASDLFTTRGSFVGNDTLARLRSMAAALIAACPEAAQLQKEIDKLGLISLERLVTGSLDSISSLARELRKPTPSVDLKNGDLSFNPQFAEALKSCLIHILRNALDHGIEQPDDRVRANKPPQGVVRFTCARRDDRLELCISDDGRGLALHKLYEQGVANGAFRADERPTPEAIADTIFQSGISTAEAVTQVSGRGVGMEAVRTFLHAQGARIHVALQEAGSVLGFTPFAFIIHVPQTAEGY
jgi:HPt (histidine-containing phosphotransfer) domain-containing protein